MNLMAEASSATDRQRHGRWQFTLRSLFLFTLSVAIGLSFWKTEGDWYGATLVTISFWIVFGLVAQVRDICTSLLHGENSTPEDRWGRRFSIFWRLALCGLIGLCFTTPFLISFHLVTPSDSREFIHVSSHAMWCSSNHLDHRCGRQFTQIRPTRSAGCMVSSRRPVGGRCRPCPLRGSSPRSPLHRVTGAYYHRRHYVGCAAVVRGRHGEHLQP